MKRIFALFTILLLLTFSACDNKEETEEIKSETTTGNIRTVKVLDHMDASSYTYMQVDENGDEYWIAVPQMPVEKGETLYFSKSMKMENFKSESLNRTFETVLFVEDVSRNPHAENKKMGHPDVMGTKEAVSVEPLEDGKTVKDIFDQKESLSGKTVKLRGKVTKYNAGIMGRNWIHIQDGTGEQGKHDLVVTSNESAQVGETVVVEGTIALDKDFGSGYTYAVLLENATVKTE